MVPLVSSVISCQATAGFKSRVEHKCYFKAWFPFSPPPQDTNTQSANQCQLWEWGWKLSVSCDSVMSESTRTHGAHQTYQHPHDIRPQLGKTVGGSSAFCPWLIRSCTGPLISLHCAWRSNLCSVSLIGWKVWIQVPGSPAPTVKCRCLRQSCPWRTGERIQLSLAPFGLQCVNSVSTCLRMSRDKFGWLKRGK